MPGRSEMDPNAKRPAAGGVAKPARAAAPLPDDGHIVARDIHFDIAGNATRRWFGGDLHKTALIDGLSIFLPEGERFFIRSLKHYAAKLKDPELAKEINGYAVQEAFHTREHEDYNKAMAGLGYDVEAMERPVRTILRNVKNPLHRLATTCAIEHLTATFSSVTLRRPELLEGAVPAYRRLWMWHALEELEHKAVALDVLKAATPQMAGWKRYLLRIATMTSTVLPFIWISVRNVGVYARRDGVKTGFRFWMRYLWVLFGKPGYWRLTVLPLLRYYLPGFDPRNSDDTALIEKGRAWLAAELAASGEAPAGYGA